MIWIWIWTPMFLTIGIVLVILTYPFTRPRGRWMPFRPASLGGDLFEQKEALLRAIKDIEFERQSGTLSTEDHDVLIGDYKRRAVAVMKRLEASGGAKEQSLRDALESEIAAERKALEAK